jgi:hypothetical protein
MALATLRETDIEPVPLDAAEGESDGCLLDSVILMIPELPQSFAWFVSLALSFSFFLSLSLLLSLSFSFSLSLSFSL